MSIKELQEYIRITKYARYLPEKNRRETWQEQITRVFDMHKEHLGEDKWIAIKDQFELAKQGMLDKKILGSQRNLQFGGKAVLKHNEKSYNCCATYIDRPRVFQEVLYVLINGCGAGIHVGNSHISKLPEITKRSEDAVEYIIEDSIEGWADAIGVLMSSYFKNSGLFDNIYENKTIKFNFDRIRPEGSKISFGGKAPGPKGLKNSIKRIEDLFERILEEKVTKLRPIHAYDIIMHISDAVLSGGIRRSAILTMFDVSDSEMATSKSGDWFINNPQRARSNNSALVNRNTATREEYLKMMETVKEYGEPAAIFVDDEESYLFNPCIIHDAPILTKKGIQKFGDLKEGDEIWSETKWTKVLKKWSTGIKKTYKYTTLGGVFYGTDNHRVLENGTKIEIKDAKSVDRLVGSYNGKPEYDLQSVVDGLVLGDGTRKDGYSLLIIGEDDQDYFSSDIKDFILNQYSNDSTYKITTTITTEELPKTFERKIPDRFFYGDYNTVCSFLRGLYTANGSICGNRVTYKTSSKDMREGIQIMLSSIGISSYYTTNKSTNVKFKNGTYTCKESYDINIATDRKLFLEAIGFIQGYKVEKLQNVINKVKSTKGSSKVSFEIKSVDYLGEEEVFDITVDNDPHTFWSGGLNVSNCVEISLRGYDNFGNSGWQFCNLSEINIKKCKTEEDFYEACKIASIIGTVQASYTSFPYLGEVTERITRREALIGVSMTGIMDNTDIALNPETLQKGAEIVIETNKEIASLIGINQAARTCCTKPSGTASALLGVSNGIHLHHAKRYFRRVQANKNESTLQYFKMFNSAAVEESVWSANKTDDVITFTCEVPNGSKFKNNLSAIDFLKNVKLVQQNWVIPGSNEELCAQKGMTHNVSNTCNVRSFEWDEVLEFIFENRKYFSGISLIPMEGDKDYHQAPFQAVYEPKELVEMYGDASMFASGLIVHAQQAFDGNLYAACDCFLGIGEKLDIPNLQGDALVSSIDKLKKILDKTTWIERAKKFTKLYFEGDKKKMTYALKDCDAWKKWVDLKREYSNVPWDKFFEDQDSTKVQDSVACSGGKCDIL